MDAAKPFKERPASITEKVVHGKGYNVGLKKGHVVVASKSVQNGTYHFNFHFLTYEIYLCYLCGHKIKDS